MCRICVAFCDYIFTSHSLSVPITVFSDSVFDKNRQPSIGPFCAEGEPNDTFYVSVHTA